MEYLRVAWKKFWEWYERHYTLNVGVSTGLFILQLVHLYWLTADVVSERITGHSHFHVEGILELIILFVDYTEIPALIGVSLIYINTLRKGYSHKALLYLIFLNSQWLHIFWITDEFVVEELTGDPQSTVLPAWLAWIALAIDYLELPVMYDTIKTFFTNVLEKVK